VSPQCARNFLRRLPNVQYEPIEATINEMMRAEEISHHETEILSSCTELSEELDIFPE
jgi:hypothetical protein